MSTMVYGAASSRSSPSFTLGEATLVMLLWIATAIVLGKDITVGGFRYGDSAVHAMDGVLIHDWVSAGPGRAARSYSIPIHPSPMTPPRNLAICLPFYAGSTCKTPQPLCLRGHFAPVSGYDITT